MPAIVVATIKIEDAASLDAYRLKAGAAIAKHGGTPLVAGPPNRLEGDRPDQDAVALFEFPDSESAHAWIEDPELADLHALRNKAGRSQIVLIGS